MTFRGDWQAEFANDALASARFICPHCGLPSTFSPVAQHIEGNADPIAYYLVLKCNYTPCRKNVYVVTTKRHNQMQQHSDEVSIHPTRPILQPHEAIPPAIGEDWVEAQKAFEVGAVKAAAVMCRRVLYGVLLDRKCREHPLNEGLQELTSRERLPGVVERWVNEIKEEGHDAAHPHRALNVPTENVAETMEYTKELLRFVYIEPFELEQRLTRKAAQTKN